MKVDISFGFVQQVHLKGKPNAWMLWVQDPKLDLLKSFPNKTSSKKIGAGSTSTEYFEVTAGPDKGNTLAVVNNANNSREHSLITPGYIAVRDLTL